MSCLPISPFAVQGGCAPRMGGIRSILWIKRSGVTVNSVDFEPANGDYSLDLYSFGGNKAYRVPVRSGSFASTAEVNDDGTTYYRDELTFVPAAGQQSAAALLAALTAASDDTLVLIAEGYNGEAWVLGLGFTDAAGAVAAYPVWQSGGSVQSGAARGDLAGGQVTVASVHPLPAASAGLADIEIANPNDF